MKNYTTQQLREELSKRGYFTGNLWHIDDVKSMYNLTDIEAMDVLDKSLTNEYIMEQIWFAIGQFEDTYELKDDEHNENIH